MARVKKYFFSTGCMYLSERNAQGLPVRTWDLGNIRNFSFLPNVSEVVHRDNCDPARSIDGTVTIVDGVTVSFTIDSLAPDNLALFHRGTSTLAAAGGTVTNEAFTLGPDKIIRTRFPNISAVVANAVLPTAVLIPTTDYTVERAGIIKIATTNPVTSGTLNYSYGVRDISSVMTDPNSKDYMVTFTGVNQADNNSQVTVDLFRCNLWAAGAQEFIQDVGGQYANLPITGRVMQDLQRAPDPLLGRFGAIQSFV